MVNDTTYDWSLMYLVEIQNNLNIELLKNQLFLSCYLNERMAKDVVKEIQKQQPST